MEGLSNGYLWICFDTPKNIYTIFSVDLQDNTFTNARLSDFYSVQKSFNYMKKGGGVFTYDFSGERHI